MKIILTFILLGIMITSCSTNNSDNSETIKPSEVSKKIEPKYVKVLSEKLLGEGTSKPFKSSKGEFYLVANYKNDCSDIYPNGIDLIVQPTTNVDMLKQDFSFTGDQLKFGQSTTDTLRVYSIPDTYYIQTFLVAGCKINIEVFDLQ